MHNEDRRYQVLERLEREGLGLSRLLISLATGTLVLSITFLQLLHPPLREHTSILVSSWIALVVSIVLGLVDRIIYINGLAEHPLMVQTETEAEREYQKQQWLKYANASEKVSWLHIISFIAGLTLLLIFAINVI